MPLRGINGAGNGAAPFLRPLAFIQCIFQCVVRIEGQADMPKRSENQNLFNLETPAKPQGLVECLGMTFENDERDGSTSSAFYEKAFKYSRGMGRRHR